MGTLHREEGWLLRRESVPQELYCRVQGLAPLLPRLTRLVMTGIGDLRVRDSGMEHSAVWLASTNVPPGVPPAPCTSSTASAPPTSPALETDPQPCHLPHASWAGDTCEDVQPPGLASAKPVPDRATSVSAPAGRSGVSKAHCDEVHRIQEQWCRRAGRSSSHGLPEEEADLERSEALSELARANPLGLREVCLIFKALDVSFVAQLGAAVAVPIQGALFEEVAKSESVLAGVIDNEEVPRGPYHALFTCPDLVGDCGARLLSGCRQVCSGKRLSKQHLFRTYGL
jgi:hypothetical protein